MPKLFPEWWNPNRKHRRTLAHKGIYTTRDLIIAAHSLQTHVQVREDDPVSIAIEELYAFCNTHLHGLVLHLKTARTEADVVVTGRRPNTMISHIPSKPEPLATVAMHTTTENETLYAAQEMALAATTRTERVDADGFLLADPNGARATMCTLFNSLSKRMMVEVDDDGTTFMCTQYTGATINGNAFEVGDAIYLTPDGQGDPCEIGRIAAFFKSDDSGDDSGDDFVQVQWFWRPEHLVASPFMSVHTREIFLSSTMDVQPIDAIEQLCTVIRSDGDDGGAELDLSEPHTFFFRRMYDTDSQTFVECTANEVNSTVSMCSSDEPITDCYGWTQEDVDRFPDDVLCPITTELFEDPVVAADGHTYERSAILAWLSKHDTSPMTNEPLATKIIFDNIAMRKIVERLIA